MNWGWVSTDFMNLYLYKVIILKRGDNYLDLWSSRCSRFYNGYQWIRFGDFL